MTSEAEEEESRSIEAILRDILKHREENPTHGTNCACMDKYSHEITRQILRVFPDLFKWDRPRGFYNTPESKSYYSLHHVLSIVIRKL